MHLSIFPRPQNLSVLCLGAHCDDIEIGCGGTLIKWIAQGLIGSLTWVVFASNPIRAKEARHSAEAYLNEVPQKDIVIKSYRDAFLNFSAEQIKGDFEEIKRSAEPDLIFTHYREDRHQDHRLLSDLSWNTFRNHLILEYEIPKYDGDLGQPNAFVSITEDQLNLKIGRLMEAYETQRSKHWFDRQTFMALPRLRGMEAATPFAEAFYVRKMIIT